MTFIYDFNVIKIDNIIISSYKIWVYIYMLCNSSQKGPTFVSKFETSESNPNPKNLTLITKSQT